VSDFLLIPLLNNTQNIKNNLLIIVIIIDTKFFYIQNILSL